MERESQNTVLSETMEPRSCSCVPRSAANLGRYHKKPASPASPSRPPAGMGMGPSLLGLASNTVAERMQYLYYVCGGRSPTGWPEEEDEMLSAALHHVIAAGEHTPRCASAQPTRAGDAARLWGRS